MKILSIGNSFSHDSHKWLHKLAKANGVDLYTANLFIGGCSLQTHWTNIVENNAFYDYEINGEESDVKISIIDALKKEEWDVITLQQASNFSGMYETYQPYLNSIADLVKTHCPNSIMYFHQTWAYEIDSTHEGFSNYNNNQNEMYECIIDASKKAAESIKTAIIPTGTVIQHLRNSLPEFDYKNGGKSLCRDGFHMSFDYGRFAAASTWFNIITGKDVNLDEFEDFDTDLIKLIVNEVNKICNNYR